jgi:small-conductance mechanosensitive channel
VGEEFGKMLSWLRSSGPRVLAILIGSLLLVRFLRAVSERIPRLMPVEEGPAITEREKRARTVVSLVRTVGTSLVLLIAVMMVFREIGLDITPLIAGAGVMGLAIGFGAQSLAEDVTFSKLVLEPPQVLGVEALAESQVTVRMLAKTLPLKQWDVARELRRRIKARFDREGIQIPYPHRVVITRPSPSASGN